MREFMLKYLLKMWQIILVALVAGFAGEYFFQQRWLGFWCVAVPLCAVYMYQQYALIDNEKKKLEKKKHTNKYR